MNTTKISHDEAARLIQNGGIEGIRERMVRPRKRGNTLADALCLVEAEMLLTEIDRLTVENGNLLYRLEGFEKVVARGSDAEYEQQGEMQYE